MPTRRTARARAGTRRRSQRNMMAIGRGKHGAGRNSRPAKLQSNFSPRTPEQQRKPRSTRDQRAKRFNNLENPTKSAKPPPPVQIRAAPQLHSQIVAASAAEVDQTATATRGATLFLTRHSSARARRIWAFRLAARPSRPAVSPDGPAFASRLIAEEHLRLHPRP